MLDNLRDQASSSPFLQEDGSKPELPKEQKPPKPPKPPRPHRTFDQMTGMTALQRFALVFMLFIIVCLLGAALLVLTEKVVLPF